jgi:hypothetical protein
MFWKCKDALMSINDLAQMVLGNDNDFTNVADRLDHQTAHTQTTSHFPLFTLGLPPPQQQPPPSPLNKQVLTVSKGGTCRYLASQGTSPLNWQTGKKCMIPGPSFATRTACLTPPPSP